MGKLFKDIVLIGYNMKSNNLKIKAGLFLMMRNA